MSSLTLFVTHYPSLAELEVAFPKHITNNHMAFVTSQEQQSDQQCPEGGEGESIPSVTFLYHVVNGAAARSYGLNVAPLAGIPSEILNTAAKKITRIGKSNHPSAVGSLLFTLGLPILISISNFLRCMCRSK